MQGGGAGPQPQRWHGAVQAAQRSTQRITAQHSTAGSAAQRSTASSATHTSSFRELPRKKSMICRRRRVGGGSGVGGRFTAAAVWVCKDSCRPRSCGMGAEACTAASSACHFTLSMSAVPPRCRSARARAATCYTWPADASAAHAQHVATRPQCRPGRHVPLPTTGYERSSRRNRLLRRPRQQRQPCSEQQSPLRPGLALLIANAYFLTISRRELKGRPVFLLAL